MAVLQITIIDVDQGTPTGDAANNVRRVTYALDSVAQDNCIQTFPSATTDVDAAAGQRALLTANGVTWASEDAVLVNP